jgi:hypothetical protein
MKVRSAIIGAALVAGSFSAEGAQAQFLETKVWDIALGTHVSDLPRDEFPIQACGTNGGPPSALLDGFEEFARCAVEDETGLHEVWFSYDDEEEGIARAYRFSEDRLGQYRANDLFTHPVLFSLLIDANGLVQGYRVVSDNREDPATRFDADTVARPLKLSVFGSEGWNCVNLPALPGETAILDRFIKEFCEKTTDDGRKVTIATHVYMKPRQDVEAVVLRGENEFVASVRLVVINADLAGARP